MLTLAHQNLAVSVEFVRHPTDVPDSLWAACFPPPLEGRFWYETLERSHLEDQFAFSYALIRREGQPVGLAPCFLHDVPITLVAPPAVAWVLNQLARAIPRVGYQRTFFIGSPCSDEGTIGLVPGVTLAEIAPALALAVRAQARELGARMIVFKDFPAADATVLENMPHAGEFVSTLSYPGCVVPLPPPDKAAYYQSLTHGHRHNLLKKLRRSREALALDTQVLASPSDAELAEIGALFQQTYARGKTKFERLGPEFFAQIRTHREASFVVQRETATGAMVAFMLVFRLGDRVINKFIGLDYARAGKTFLYFRLFDAAVDFAYAAGAGELQSGQTGYRAKFDLGHRLVPLHNVFRHENPLIHVIFRTIGRRITWTSLDPDLAGHDRADRTSGA